MPTTERGACEWFVWDLRRSNLMDRGQIDQIVGEFLKKKPTAEPPALAEYLVQKELITPFQAERLLEGKTQGLVLGPYTLADALGTGSMGTVYKAQSKTDGRWYAVKVLPRRSMWNVRIARRQVRAFEQLRHPAVVPFVDVGTSGGTHYLAWPLVEGESLEDLVRRNGKLRPGVAAQLVLQAAEGLDACHQQGLVHGLIKPSNLMVGEDRQVRVLDYGIGALLAESDGESLVDTMSTANTLTSGLDCASPESIMEPTNRTPAGDQYSLGCVLYFCLTGDYPFTGGTAVEKMMAHQTKAPPPVRDASPEAPEALVAVVERLMQKAPEARYASMADVVAALTPLADAVTATPRPVRPVPGSAELRKGPPPQPPAPPAEEPGSSEAALTLTPLPAGLVQRLREELAPVNRVAEAPAAPPAPRKAPVPDFSALPGLQPTDRTGGVLSFVVTALLVGMLAFLTWWSVSHS